MWNIIFLSGKIGRAGSAGPAKKIITLVLFFLIALNAFAFGRREAARESQTSPENSLSFLGVLVIYGNEPVTFAGIVSVEGNEYAVYPRDMVEELRTLQGHLIEFTIIPLGEEEARGLENPYLGGGWVRLLSYKIIE